MQLITFPKCHHSSKSIRGDQRYLQFCVRKPVRLAEIHFYFISFFIQHHFQPILRVFWHKIENIFGLRGWILMNDGILETLWVALSIIKNSPQNFTNFITKFGSKVEISWNLEEVKWIFLYSSKVSSYLLGHILLFWKDTMQAIHRTPKNY